MSLAGKANHVGLYNEREILACRRKLRHRRVL